MWLVVQRVQVKRQKWWYRVCCSSTRIATDPECPALWQGSVVWGRLRKQVTVALGKTLVNLFSRQVQTTKWWSKWELGRLSNSRWIKINACSRAKQRTQILRLPALPDLCVAHRWIQITVADFLVHLTQNCLSSFLSEGCFRNHATFGMQFSKVWSPFWCLHSVQRECLKNNSSSCEAQRRGKRN